jgi:hypothetical protein
VGSALVDELPVVADHLLGIDGDVSLGGVEIGVAEQLRGDGDRQASVDGLGRENSPEVVRREPQWCLVDVDDAGPQRMVGEEFTDSVGEMTCSRCWERHGNRWGIGGPKTRS